MAVCKLAGITQVVVRADKVKGTSVFSKGKQLTMSSQLVHYLADSIKELVFRNWLTHVNKCVLRWHMPKHPSGTISQQS